MNDMMHLSDNISGFSVCRPFSPSEGVRKMRKTARLRKVGKVGAAAVVGMLLLCAVSFDNQSRAEELPANGYIRQQWAAGDDERRISGVVVEAGKRTPVAGAVVLYVPAGQEGTEYALSDVQGRFELQVSGRHDRAATDVHLAGRVVY